MANSICKRCKFYDRCDEDNLMRSYVTSADKDGCPHYGMLSAFDDVEEKQNQMWAEQAEKEKQRRQERFKERIGRELDKVNRAIDYIDEYLDKLAVQQGISKFPTDNMHPMMYGVGYMTWEQIRSQIEPFDSDAIVNYNDFIERNEDLDHGYKKRDPREPYNLCIKKIDEILKAYRDYGLTGPGAQREEIHKQAVEWKQFIDKKAAEEKAKKEEEERQRREKEEEERKRKAEERARKAEQERQKEQKRQELREIHKQKNKKFWIIWGVVAVFVLLIGSLLPTIMALGFLGLIAAVAIHYYLQKKELDSIK